MKKRKWLIIIIASIICLVLLNVYTHNSSPVVSIDKVDKVIIWVKDDKGQKREWKAQDPNFFKTLLGNLNLVFGNSNKNAQRFDSELTSKQKEFEYQIRFYKGDNIIQDIKISHGDKVNLDKKEFTIGKEKEKELDSLKYHLLMVTNSDGVNPNHNFH